ncbi:nose resistant to fluoxetine protein 6 [Trichonephila inaurata madagascariensis]|uniref:Nose resistant to fluoxetine protein 6 n=1 Tax=Trichonephila inaurata madagascariensis TaxID=2747483 RepID=A0A8X6YC53_9ARAC|nr:nose resistant to fluoxetine protein 6 [Trichonephila inaurata madagascariensis]
MSGTVTSLGEFEQCLETVVPHPKRKDEILFQGQYCLVEIRPPLPVKQRRFTYKDQLEELSNYTGSEFMEYFSTKAHLMYSYPFRLGICIPSGCTQNDLAQVFDLVSNKLNINVTTTPCKIKEEKKSFMGIQIFSICFICFLGFLVLLGTWMEIRSSSENIRSESLLHRIILSFSIISNFKQLISTKTSESNLSSLHGIRFLSLIWVVLCHSYLFPGFFKPYYRSLFRAAEVAMEPVAQMIVNGTEAMSTFLFLEGLLASYSILKQIKPENKDFRFRHFLLHRLWRIAPVYYVFLLGASLVPLMTSGPIFDATIARLIYPCFQYSWRNVIFINNFFHMDDMCMLHTWYVSVVVQLYILALIFIFLLIRSKKIGIILNILIIFASIAYTGVATYFYDLQPTMTVVHIDEEDSSLFFKYSFANTISRAGPYFVGILIGYILVKKPDIKIPKEMLVMGWFLAVLSSGLIVLITGVWYGVDKPTALQSVIYSAFYKVAFTAGVAWVTFCCTTGHAGFINTVLSWKAWVPLSKLVFVTYLIQPIIQLNYIASFRTIQEFTHLQFIVQGFGFLVISTFLGFLCNMLIESPCLCIENNFFNPESKTEETNEAKNLGFENDDIKMKMKGKTEMMLTLENGLDHKKLFKTDNENTKVHEDT